MPLVKVWVGPGRSIADKRRLLEAVHLSLVEGLDVPVDDRTQIVLEHDGAEAPATMSRDFVLVEVFLRPGRSDERKQSLYSRVHANLGAAGVPPSDVLVALHEIALENWGFPGEPSHD
jgi:phenylpyruvate tautomerase PptA (4-oxalocrotonate tautomerase family)